MAITVSALLSEHLTETASAVLDVTSSSFTPPNASLLVLVVAAEADAGTGDIGEALTVTGGGLTWTNRVERGATGVGGYSATHEIWTAPVVTGASMTIRVQAATNSADPTRVLLHVIACTGHDVASPIGATGENDIPDLDGHTLTLSASPAITSYVFGTRYMAAQVSGDYRATPGTGWTEIYDTGTGGDGYGSLQTQSRTGSTSATVTWDDVSDIANAQDYATALAIEIKEAGGGGGGGGSGTRVQRFYPSAVVDDQTFTSEATIRKLVETAPAANTTTTVTWTTATITEKTVIPVTANSAAGDTSNNSGWAFNNGGADGLNSVVGARRKILAGVWAFSAQFTLNTPALLDTHALTIEANVYRVATGGGARTLLFSATSANQTANATATWNSASQPEIILEAGQVIMVGYTATSASTQALVLGANTNTVMTFALGANTWFDVPAPGIRTDIAQTNSLTGVGVSTRTLAITQARSATGKGIATESRAVSASKTFSLTGRGAVTHTKAITQVRNAVGKGIITETRTVAASKSFDLVGRGVVTRTLAVALSRSAEGRGVITYTKMVTASKTFSLVGVGTVTETRSVQAQRSFSLTGKGDATRTVAVAIMRSAAGKGDITFTRALIASKTFDLIARGVVSRQIAVALMRNLIAKGIITETHPVQANRTFTLTGKGVVTGRIEIPIDEVPTGEGGGTTYPDGLLVLRNDGRIISVPGSEGAPPPGAMRIYALP